MKILREGQPIFIRHEPSNPFDQNAIGVYLKVSTLSREQLTALESILTNDDPTIKEIILWSEWQLGYIPAALAKALRDKGYVGYHEEIPATFTISSNRLSVRFTIGETENASKV